MTSSTQSQPTCSASTGWSTDRDFVLSNENFSSLKLAKEGGSFDDDREVSEKRFWKSDPCMTNCLPGTAAIVGRARVIDVTPEAGKGPKVD